MSKWKDKIKGYRKQLNERHKQEQEKKPKRRFGSIFLDMPEDLEFWKCEEGRHEIDVIPFLAGPNHPEVDEGELAYGLDLVVHQSIGPTNENFVCPRDNWGKACPICEYIEKNRPIPKEDFTALGGKDRTVYFVWCHDTPKEEKEGVKVWELARFFFGDPVKEMSKASVRGGGAVIWSDYSEEGKSIAFTKEGKGQGNIRYLGHRFVDRKEPLPDWILDNVLGEGKNLDSLIKMHPTYDEISEAFYGGKTTAVTREPISKSDCPQGATFGKDFKTLDECHDCALWDECQDKHESLSPARSKPDEVVDEVDEEPKKKSRRRRR